MNKMQKLTCAKVFKVIFYLLGFPLLLLLVAKDSMVFFDEKVFSQTATDGITAIVILWAAFTLIQIGLYLVMKKQQALRTVILVALVIVMMLAPIAGLDKYAAGKVEDASAKYTAKGAVVKDYSLQKQWFNTLSDKGSYVDGLNKNLTEFIRVYGLDGYNPNIYRTRTQLNTVPYFVGDNGNGERYDIKVEKDGGMFEKLVKKGENPVAYNPNGTLYDGYIYGVEYAVDLLIEYNEFKASANTTRIVGTTDTINEADAVAGKYKVKDEDEVLRQYTGPQDFTTDASDDTKIYFDGTFYEVLTIDQALEKAINTAEGSSAWTEYSSSEDYVAKKAIADQYVLDADRLDEVLSVLLEYLGMNPDLNQFGESIADILDVLPGLGLIDNLEEILAGLRYPARYLFGENLIRIDAANGEDVAYENYKAAMIAAEDERATNNSSEPRYYIAALTDLLKGLSPALPLVGGLLTGTVADLIKGLLPIDLSLLGLTDAKINALVTQILGLALDPATGVDLTALTTQGVEDLLMGILSELSYYHHPDLKYVWQFIDGDDKALKTDAGQTVDLSRYAWVKFTCESWGVTNGCALATREGGLLTGKTLGGGASADDAFTLAELYQLRADLDYMPDAYPLLAARRYMSMWAGILAISIFMYTYFYNKERKYGYEILLAGGEY